jgi:hypothetical protein
MSEPWALGARVGHGHCDGLGSAIWRAAAPIHLHPDPHRGVHPEGFLRGRRGAHDQRRLLAGTIFRPETNAAAGRHNQQRSERNSGRKVEGSPLPASAVAIGKPAAQSEQAQQAMAMIQ